jgi:hypothetical protein
MANMQLPTFRADSRPIRWRCSAVFAPLCGGLVLAIALSQGPHVDAQTKKSGESSGKARGKSAENSEGKPSGASKSAKNRRITETEGIGTYTSRNFLVHTDLTADQAKELLARLETMLGLISKYWGRPPSGIIEMYVVGELRKWPLGVMEPEGRASVERGGGLTISQTISRGDAFIAKAVVYAVADRGTPQHEAVHAYCAQAFGRTGPVWYSEGMAEMGQYWQTDNASVNADELVIKYLRNSEVKSLNEIVNGVEWTGDSWQNYAWRWALCHLLANNPNYAQRFRPLGLGILTNQEVSFEKSYGDMAKEISFEYRQFIEHLERGLRIDLCGWDWKAKFKPVKTSAITTAKIEARRGWQASRLGVTKGTEYEFSVEGSWSTSKSTPSVSADGNDGAGRLVGALLRDLNGEYRLEQQFDLGSFGTFVAPDDGNLYLRCQDEWVQLADNSGSLVVKLKLKDKGAPLAPPKEEDPSGKRSKAPRAP